MTQAIACSRPVTGPPPQDLLYFSELYKAHAAGRGFPSQLCKADQFEHPDVLHAGICEDFRLDGHLIHYGKLQRCSWVEDILSRSLQQEPCNDLQGASKDLGSRRTTASLD